MFICLLWAREISYIHLWQAHYSTQGSLTTQNDTEETYSHCTTSLTKDVIMPTKIQLHHTIQTRQRNGLGSPFPSRKENKPIESHQNIHNIYFSPDNIACHFWGTRDELTIENGLLLKGNRLCIPPELYERRLGDLQTNHRGIEKMRHLSQTNYINCCKYFLIAGTFSKYPLMYQTSSKSADSIIRKLQI